MGYWDDRAKYIVPDCFKGGKCRNIQHSRFSLCKQCDFKNQAQLDFFS